ncbi:uncharacterized protein LOC117120587 [Anneissia japonica]|uniref:uncharacterized protein LOC117120587 n=1 Tax=Anneissia japonica TaxID=1529436 RepID=UPI001425772A|nr:uncharacterized protein LOC117120587 [Anneissia japonica]
MAMTVNKSLTLLIGVYTLFITVKYCSCEEEKPYCTFFNNRAPTEQPNLSNCTWYKDQCCCRNPELISIFKKVKPLKGATKECQQYLNYLMCYICAPNQHLFYNQQRLTVCEEFCNGMRNSCSDAILKGSKIGILYTTGRDFCESRRFEVKPVSTGKCFTYDQLEDDTKASDAEARFLWDLRFGVITVLFAHVAKTFF